VSGGIQSCGEELLGGGSCRMNPESIVTIASERAQEEAASLASAGVASS
jgi:hypothetical protein